MTAFPSIPSSIPAIDDVAELSHDVDSTLLHRLRPVAFTIPATGQRTMGFLAEEVRTIYPGLVDAKGVVDYLRIGAVLAVAEVQKLGILVNDLRMELELLKAAKSG